MTSLSSSYPFTTAPDYSKLLENLDSITLRLGTFETMVVTDLTVSTITVDPSSEDSGIVTPDGEQLLKNKQLEDSSTTIVAEGNDTKILKFNVSNSANTTLRINANATVDTILDIPDVSADAEFVLTRGDQTIRGEKTFTGTITCSTFEGQDGITLATTPVNIGTNYSAYHGFSRVTNNTTPASVGTVPFANNHAFLINVDVLATTSDGLVAAFNFRVRAKKVDSVVTIRPIRCLLKDVSNGMQDCSVDVEDSGGGMSIMCTGLSSRVSWVANAFVTFNDI